MNRELEDIKLMLETAIILGHGGQRLEREILERVEKLLEELEKDE
jgi:hypothetical protein